MNTLTRRPSIRTQLLFWLVIPILVLLLVGLALTYGLAISLATDAYDKALLDSVYSVARCIQVVRGKVVVDLPPAALAILREDISDKVYYQVLDRDLKVIAGDQAMPQLHENPDLVDNSADYQDGTIDGEQVRIATVCVPLPASGGRKIPIYVQVAQTMHSREQIADEILISVVLPQLAIVLMSAGLVWFGVRRGLAPLTSLRDALASKSAVDMRPIAVEDVPKEVRPLVHAINELLERLQQDIQAQRRFVANAAHQLRTPIAGLKTQAELALRQTDPKDVKHSLNQINVGAERSARLASQLLALARAEPGAMDVHAWRHVNLNVVGRNACRELVTEAIAKDIDLGFEEAPGSAWIRGDESSLHELASNLIHNAVMYTQSGGNVTVKVDLVRDNGTFADFSVVDNGPGIPLDERDRVFERFYRLIDRRVSGSGLGLPIVREIANLHQAKVAVSDGPGGVGLCVNVRFVAIPGPSGDIRPEQRAPFGESALPVQSTATKVTRV